MELGRHASLAQKGQASPSAAGTVLHMHALMLAAASPAHPAGLPKGVLNIVHGTHDTVNRILDHPDIASISFVGSGAAPAHTAIRVVHAHPSLA